MKKISSLLALVMCLPASCWASFVKVCPLAAECKPAEMVWMQVEPFGATLNPAIIGAVIGGGLLLWGVGCGVGMFLQSVRKFR